jgi:hypothetical protein
MFVYYRSHFGSSHFRFSSYNSCTIYIRYNSRITNNIRCNISIIDVAAMLSLSAAASEWLADYICQAVGYR